MYQPNNYKIKKKIFFFLHKFVICQLMKILNLQFCEFKILTLHYFYLLPSIAYILEKVVSKSIFENEFLYCFEITCFLRFLEIENKVFISWSVCICIHVIFPWICKKSAYYLLVNLQKFTNCSSDYRGIPWSLKFLIVNFHKTVICWFGIFGFSDLMAIFKNKCV